MIDQKKKYRTRDGKEVRIYAMDGAAPYIVHGAVVDSNEWVPSSWTTDGEYAAGAQRSRDLIEVREKLTVSGWVNIYRMGSEIVTGDIHDTEEAARRARSIGSDCAVACDFIKIEIEEGAGL